MDLVQLRSVRPHTIPRAKQSTSQMCLNWPEQPQSQPRQTEDFYKFVTGRKKRNLKTLISTSFHLVSFIQTSCWDEQCITQKYKGKILVLHYTFLKYIQSKISYVSIMSCCQSAVCIVCTYARNSQHTVGLKAATYLVRVSFA